MEMVGGLCFAESAVLWGIRGRLNRNDGIDRVYRAPLKSGIRIATTTEIKALVSNSDKGMVSIHTLFNFYSLIGKLSWVVLSEI
jgi:hypothetical protein